MQGYDEPEILPSSTRRICLIGADAGQAAIAKNARSLLSDAELLFEHGRYARAAALAVLAVEEVGKFYLRKWNRAEAQHAMRDHGPNNE